MTLIILTLGLITSIAFLARTVLIIVGWYKAPVLRQFEKYGDEESVYYSLPAFLGWSGVLIITGNLWVSMVWGVVYPFIFAGGLLVATAYLAYRFPDYLGQHPGMFITHPRWLHDLHRRTTREERRRIAYMWLRLPARQRLVYSSDDRAFSYWVDMIIISTIS
jgi:hypothetical protein